MDTRIVKIDDIDSSGDKRLAELLDLIKTEGLPEDEYNGLLEVFTFSSGNIYYKAMPTYSSSREVAEAYFGERLEWTPERGARSPICNDEVLQIIGNTTTRIQYMKEFDDGLVQVVGFGDPWERNQDRSHAIYGHIVQRE